MWPLYSCTITRSLAPAWLGVRVGVCSSPTWAEVGSGLAVQAGSKTWTERERKTLFVRVKKVKRNGESQRAYEIERESECENQ